MHKKPFDIVKRGFPILKWVPDYNVEKAIADVIAGITVGLTLIPQSIAYAVLAGLEPQYGLYSSLCGGIIYAVFGTVPEINIAPTALLSLLTFTYTSSAPFGSVPAAVLLCLFSGLIEACCGLLHLGFLVDFVSAPVVAGLTSAGAILVASAQVKNMLGLQFSAEKFVDMWVHIIKNIDKTKLWDAVLSLCCCVLLLSLRKLKDVGIAPLASNKEKQVDKFKILKKIAWFISVGRNALIVIGCTALAYILNGHTTDSTQSASQNNTSTHFNNQTINADPIFSLTNPVPSGLPNIAFPQFEATFNERTYTFVEMAKELGSGIFVVPFIAILANVAVAKAFARGKVLDASQEMLAVGICNIVGSLFSSYPVNASFSRAAVSNASGVRTTFSGIYTGIMVILSLTFLTPYFAYIPKATLSSVIICAVIFMVEVNISRLIWKMNKIDFFPLIITFLACLLLGIEIGILIGIAIDIILVLYYIARPRIDIQRVTIEGNEYTKIIPTSSLFYPSAEYVRDRIMKSNLDHTNRIIIVDCSRIAKTDFTAVKCMGSLATDLNNDGKLLAFVHLEQSLSKLLTKACRKCIIAFTDDALKVILRERRDSDILNNYKNLNVLNGTISKIDIPHCTTKL